MDCFYTKIIASLDCKLYNWWMMEYECIIFFSATQLIKDRMWMCDNFL
jgi:hypothetical protein